jgi:hypothetical protein
MQQRVQHALAQQRLVLHRGVGRDLDFFASAQALGSQPRLFHLDLSVAELCQVFSTPHLKGIFETLSLQKDYHDIV